MTLGAEPKKVIILAVIVVGGLAYYLLSGDSTPSPAPRPIQTSTIVAPPSAGTFRAPAKARTQVRAASEFRPRVLGTRPDDKTDPASIDPELRLDLLAKVQAVEPIAAGRNLFQFGAAPAPDKPVPVLPKGVPQIPINHQPTPPPPTITSLPAGPPAAPPINLKYYGFAVSKADGHKQAFLMDGDDVIVAGENQTVKQRYRIVRIALTSIDIEDTQAKDTQTLKLQDIPG